MAKIVVIKIDQSTLPEDGRKVAWQTYGEIGGPVWFHGTYCAADELFNKDGEKGWTCIYHVFQWKYI